jgi:predicted CoA-binding protein
MKKGEKNEEMYTFEDRGFKVMPVNPRRRS